MRSPHLWRSLACSAPDASTTTRRAPSRARLRALADRITLPYELTRQDLADMTGTDEPLLLADPEAPRTIAEAEPE
jgi:hypothetical protein